MCAHPFTTELDSILYSGKKKRKLSFCSFAIGDLSQDGIAVRTHSNDRTTMTEIADNIKDEHDYKDNYNAKRFTVIISKMVIHCYQGVFSHTHTPPLRLILLQ